MAPIRPRVGLARSLDRAPAGDRLVTPPSPVDAVYLSGDLLLILSMGWLVASMGRHELAHTSTRRSSRLWSAFAAGRSSSRTRSSRGRPQAALLRSRIPSPLSSCWAARAARLRLRNAVARLLVATRRRDTLFVADAGYDAGDRRRVSSGGWLDAWLTSYMLFATAALQPSMRALGPSRPASLAIRRALVLGVGLVAVPIAMLFDRAVGTHYNAFADGRARRDTAARAARRLPCASSSGSAKSGAIGAHSSGWSSSGRRSGSRSAATAS